MADPRAVALARREASELDKHGVRGGTFVSMALAERSWCVVVPHHGRGARTARHRLATELANAVAPALLADAVAVLAELVGNAVRHADPLPGEVIRVAWRLRSDAGRAVIRIRVTDGGAAGSPRLRTVGPDAADGRGLSIVAALAVDWGVERDGLGQSVWADLVGSPGATPADADRMVRTPQTRGLAHRLSDREQASKESPPSRRCDAETAEAARHLRTPAV